MTEQGLAQAQFNLGGMYVSGLGVSQDYKEALNWWHKAAEQGLAEAQNNIGFMYQNGKGVQRDYKEAYAWFDISVAQGYEKASEGRGGVAKKLPPKALLEAQELSKKYYKLYAEPFQEP